MERVRVFVPGIPPQMVVGLFWCPCKAIPNLKYRGSLDFPELINLVVVSLQTATFGGSKP